jgi:hypothetical protein
MWFYSTRLILGHVCYWINNVRRYVMPSKQEIEAAAKMMRSLVNQDLPEGVDACDSYICINETWSKYLAKAALEAAEAVRWQPLPTPPKEGEG